MPKGRFDSFEEFCAFVARAPGPGGAASFAESFGVSRTAAEMRLRELGLLKL
jgi:Zn-dependent peptidase ImmA (M78 family)